MIACFAEMFVSVVAPSADTALQPAQPVPPVSAIVEVTIGAAATTAAVLPVFLGFAEPIKRGAAAQIVMKQVFGVIACGALLALGNWIYSECSKQWLGAKFAADLPLLIKQPGGAGALPGDPSQSGGSGRSATGSSSAGSGDPWFAQYVG